MGYESDFEGCDVINKGFHSLLDKGKWDLFFIYSLFILCTDSTEDI